MSVNQTAGLFAGAFYGFIVAADLLLSERLEGRVDACGGWGVAWSEFGNSFVVSLCCSLEVVDS